MLLFCGVDGPATAAGTIFGGVAMNRVVDYYQVCVFVKVGGAVR